MAVPQSLRTILKEDNQSRWLLVAHGASHRELPQLRKDEEEPQEQSTEADTDEAEKAGADLVALDLTPRALNLYASLTASVKDLSSYWRDERVRVVQTPGTSDFTLHFSNPSSGDTTFPLTTIGATEALLHIRIGASLEGPSADRAAYLEIKAALAAERHKYRELISTDARPQAKAAHVSMINPSRVKRPKQEFGDGGFED